MLQRPTTLRCWLCALTTLALSCLALSVCAQAAEPEKDAQSAVEAATKAAETAKQAPADENSPEGIIKQIDTLKKTPMQPRSQEEYQQMVKKLGGELLSLSDKLLDQKLTPAQREIGVREKLKALSLLRGGDTEEAAVANRERLQKFIESLLKDESPAIAKLGRGEMLKARANRIFQGKEAANEALLAALREYLGSEPVGKGELQAVSEDLQAVNLVETCFEMNDRYDLASATLDILSGAGDNISNERLKQQVTRMLESTKKKLSLVGQPLEISGTFLDKSDVDWAAYRGKVVLVDFWATWCGPCVAELPNVLKNYEAYHEKGFEVLGISLDDNAEKVEKFLADKKLPWKTLFSHDEEANGWKHPLAVKYGIQAIPAAFLIDKDGKVISLSARGERLSELLAKKLGPANGTETKPAAKPEAKAGADAQPINKEVQVAANVEAAKKPDAASDELKLKGNPYMAGKRTPPEDLVEYLSLMREKADTIKKREGFHQAVVDAADRVLKSDLPAKQKNVAILAKLESLHALSLADETSDFQKEIQELLAMAKDAKDVELAGEVKFQALEQRALKSDSLSKEEQAALLNDLEKYFTSEVPVTRQTRLVSRTVHLINAIENDEQAKAEMKKFGPLFRKSKDQDLVRSGRKLMEASGAEGNPQDSVFKVGQALEISGTLLDGSKFDWSKYRGKVVLIDFWATWCGPCRAELPNVKENYEKFHDKGFEVVAVSLDEDQDALVEFLKENEIPWDNLFEPGGKNPLAEKLGVRAIPTAILVDKDGKIIAPEARGPALGKLLQKHLGAADAAKGGDEKTPHEDKPADAPKG